MKKDTGISNVNSQEHTVIEENCSRRTFMKKAVYAAPKLIVLGYLTQPKSAMAEEGGGAPSGPIGPPTGGGTPSSWTGGGI